MVLVLSTLFFEYGLYKHFLYTFFDGTLVNILVHLFDTSPSEHLSYHLVDTSWIACLVNTSSLLPHSYSFRRNRIDSIMENLVLFRYSPKSGFRLEMAPS